MEDLFMKKASAPFQGRAEHAGDKVYSGQLLQWSAPQCQKAKSESTSRVEAGATGQGQIDLSEYPQEMLV